MRLLPFAVRQAIRCGRYNLRIVDGVDVNDSDSVNTLSADIGWNET